MHIEVNFSDFPLIGDFDQQRGYQAQARRLIGEYSGDPSAPFEFHVHPFDGVAGAPAALVSRREAKDREPLREVRLHPGSQLRGAFGVSGDGLFVGVHLN